MFLFITILELTFNNRDILSVNYLKTKGLGRDFQTINFNPLRTLITVHFNNIYLFDWPSHWFQINNVKRTEFFPTAGWFV